MDLKIGLSQSFRFMIWRLTLMVVHYLDTNIFPIAYMGSQKYVQTYVTVFFEEHVIICQLKLT